MIVRSVKRAAVPEPAWPLTPAANASITLPAAVACGTDGRPTRAIEEMLDGDGTKSTVIAAPRPAATASRSRRCRRPAKSAAAARARARPAGRAPDRPTSAAAARAGTDRSRLAGDQAAFLQGRQQPRRGRRVDTDPPRQLVDAKPGRDGASTSSSAIARATLPPSGARFAASLRAMTPDPSRLRRATAVAARPGTLGPGAGLGGHPRGRRRVQRPHHHHLDPAGREQVP